MPQLPSTLHGPIKRALRNERIRRMPCNFLTASRQGSSLSKPGATLIGDSWNIRHPLTGGGMTVAFNDVVQLRNILDDVDDLGDWHQVSVALGIWYRRRKPLASTVNMLSLVLYEMFGAADEELAIMRRGCFKYFELGGEYVRGTVSLLAGISQSPFQLFRHFFSVALYAIWVMITTSTRSKNGMGAASPLSWSEHYIALAWKSIFVIWKTCTVFFPLLWEEVWRLPPHVSSPRPGPELSVSRNVAAITAFLLLYVAYLFCGTPFI